jgi:hypothetical protein
VTVGTLCLIEIDAAGWGQLISLRACAAAKSTKRLPEFTRSPAKSAEIRPNFSWDRYEPRPAIGER